MAEQAFIQPSIMVAAPSITTPTVPGTQLGNEERFTDIWLVH